MNDTWIEIIKTFSPLVIAGISVLMNGYAKTKVLNEKLLQILEQVKKTNARVTKLEDYNMEHLKEYHSTKHGSSN